MEINLTREKTGNETLEYLKKLLPYIIIFFASLFAAWILVYKGYPTGDDVDYHFSNMYDMYLELKSGNISEISGTLASGLGFGKNLFYSPFAHLSTCILALILEPFGVSLMNAFKINMFISVCLSGIFMYHFAMHISKKVRISLLASLIYVLYPYRFFDMFCRVAIAEAYSFLFIPLFFMGLYDLVHYKEEGLVKIYLEIILGGSLLFLTHNITSIYAYVFGVIYLLFHIKDIIHIIKKDKAILPLSLIACVILLGITAGTLFSALSLYQTKLYNVSIEKRMWTYKEYLAGRSDYNWYSGLLNMDYFTSFTSGITYPSAILDGLYYGLLTFGAILLTDLTSFFMKKNGIYPKYAKYMVPSLVILISVGLSFLLLKRTEAILGVILFDAVYLFLLFEKNFEMEKKKDILVLALLSIVFYMASVVLSKGVLWGIMIAFFLIYTGYKLYMGRKKHFDLDLCYAAVMLLVTFLLIVVPGIWYVMPSFLRSIQFPWRLWAYVSFFTAMSVPMILKDSKNEALILMTASMTCFLLSQSQAVREKILAAESGSSSKWVYAIDESRYQKSGAIGACREYFPYMYYPSDSYTSKYSNSLYPEVRKYICVSAYIGQEQNINPVILEGKGTISDFKKGAPEESFAITVTKDDTLVELPLIYYPGYVASLTDDDGNVVKITAEETDGLVSFRLDSGTYTLKTSYEGTGLMKLGHAYQHVAIYGLFVFEGFIMLYEMKKKRKEVKY